MNDETKAALDAPLDPSKVARLSFGGRNLSYLEGWYVISAANGIFGYDGWHYEVLSIEAIRSWPVTRKRYDGSEYDTTVTLYQARVRVEALGISRIDVGTSLTAEDTPEAHETAIKGAATDGLKRALRTFGAQFGNDLYEKSGTRNDSAPAAQQRPQERAMGAEPTRPAGFANVGALMSWALATHKMTRGNVLDTLGAATPADIDLDTAAERIEAALVPAGASR